MAEKRLTVDENGEVDEEKAHIDSGDKVLWEPTVPNAQVRIEFEKKHPFKELKWIDKKGKGKKVSGTARANGKGTYLYTAEFIPVGGGKVARARRLAQPQIIVDGGLTPKPSKRKAVSKSSRAGTARPKAATKRVAAKRVAKKR